VKRICCIAIICLGWVQFAVADDFKTSTGQEYKNARVSRVEPDGIVIIFSGGIVKIPFTELPPEAQKKYGYDPQAAAVFQQQTYQADVLRARQLAEAGEKRRRELEEWNKTQAERVPEERQSIAASMHGTALDVRPAEKSLIYGTVIQVVDEGLLVSVRGTNTVGQERIQNHTIVLLLGKFPDYYDNDKIQATASLIGSHNYTAVWHYKKTVRAFEVAQINKLTEFPPHVR